MGIYKQQFASELKYWLLRIARTTIYLKVFLNPFNMSNIRPGQLLQPDEDGRVWPKIPVTYQEVPPHLENVVKEGNNYIT